MRIVIESLVLWNGKERTARPRLRIVRAEDERPNPGQHNCPCAHGTWLKRDVERTALEPTRLEVIGRGGDRNHLGVCGGILQALDLIAAASDDFPFVHDDSPDRYFVLYKCFFGFPQGLLHPLFMKGHSLFHVR